MSYWTPERIAFNRDQAKSLKISRCDDSLVALLAVESISALAEIERLQAEMVEMKERHTAKVPAK